MGTKAGPYLSVVIPAYNEEGRIEATLAEVVAYLAAQPPSEGGKPYSWEVLVVDDGSTDGTASLVKQAAQTQPCIRLLTVAHRGKGHAVRAGMLAARGEFRFFTDADLATPIAEVGRFLPLLEGEVTPALKDGAKLARAGCDVVAGSREGPGALRLGEPWRRHLMGRGFNAIISLLGVRGFADTQCGFKGFRAEAAERLFALQRCDGFAFDVELLFLARRLGLKVAQAPVTWHYREGSKVRPVRHSLAMVGEVIAMRGRMISTKYEIRNTK